MKALNLNNSLKCLFEQRKGTGVVAIQVWVKVGSKYEADGQAGITHFIEHLIFKGTGEAEGYEIAPKIEALGGNINAFTSYDNTVYHIVVPEHAFETGLELLVGAVKGPLFPDKEIAKEKRVIIEEIKMGEDHPQRKLFKELFALSYEGHPYGRPIIGYEQTVSSTERPDIMAYFKRHYTIDNMVVVVIGDFDEGAAKRLLEKGFPGLGKRPEASRSVKPFRYAGTGKTSLIEKDVKESYLALSYAAPPLVHHEVPALEVLGKILGEGDSSRLQVALKYKKGLVTNAGTYLFAPKENGLFIILATFKDADNETVLKGIDAELGRISKGSIETWEMEKAKNLVRSSHIYTSETVQGRAQEIGYYATITGNARFSGRYLRELDRVSKADVKRVLKKYITGEERSLVVLVPKAKPNPHIFRLKNGLTCVLNRNDASPSVSFMIGFVGGPKEEAAGKNGSFNVLSRMLLKGTGKKDAQAIAREIDTLAGSIDPVAGKNLFGLYGTFLSKDFKQSVSLLRELLTDTAIKERELKKVKEDVLSEIRQKDDEPVSLTFKAMYQVLYEGHPYGKDVSGTAEDVMRLSRKEIADLYKAYVSPRSAVLAISGDINLKEAEKLVGRAFARWTGGVHTLEKLPHDTSAKERTVDRQIFQTHMIFAFLGAGVASGDRYAAEVMTGVLSGMGGRIHKELREKRPYAYAVTFFNQMAYETGALGIYIGTDQKHTRNVKEVVANEIGQIRQNGFSEEEIAIGRRYIIGSQRTRMQTNGAIVSSMCLDTMYGLKADHFKRWPALIDKVTKADVDEAARKYLSLDKMVTIQVGPKPDKQ
jgi:zinc protease